VKPQQAVSLPTGVARDTSDCNAGVAIAAPVHGHCDVPFGPVLAFLRLSRRRGNGALRCAWGGDMWHGGGDHTGAA
jgi:hypothetical protein